MLINITDNAMLPSRQDRYPKTMQINSPTVLGKIGIFLFGTLIN